ncbi:hypothetical protein CSV86_007705 [Pseudomonas putida CSV86]|uniref:Uncharacterized protein n=1 Tax=Pseudomonas bharatica CSV86 TaxID=1005395 RepID=A0A7K4EBX9_9PSED|nr:hypothetical protein [Pseudomonas bharatica]NNJ15137.1 hypothetical protein [Pseudomonas bharatica CSV86]
MIRPLHEVVRDIDRSHWRLVSGATAPASSASTPRMAARRCCRSGRKQSVLVYQDFNLDGIEDLALMEGDEAVLLYPEKDGERIELDGQLPQGSELRMRSLWELACQR